MRFKVRGGTAKEGSSPLCHSCSHCTRAAGAAIRHEVLYCHTLRRQVTFPVLSCSSYSNAAAPDLWNMQQIAWSLCTDKKGNKIGFFSPQKAKELIASGKGEEPPLILEEDD